LLKFGRSIAQVSNAALGLIDLRRLLLKLSDALTRLYRQGGRFLRQVARDFVSHDQIIEPIPHLINDALYGLDKPVDVFSLLRLRLFQFAEPLVESGLLLKHELDVMLESLLEIFTAHIPLLSSHCCRESIAARSPYFALPFLALTPHPHSTGVDSFGVCEGEGLDV
jgi:hypothetical protein